jgi:hypothetical protein
MPAGNLSKVCNEWRICKGGGVYRKKGPQTSRIFPSKEKSSQGKQPILKSPATQPTRCPKTIYLVWQTYKQLGANRQAKSIFGAALKESSKADLAEAARKK